VSVLCAALEVSLSGYSEWRKPPLRQHARSAAQLAEQMQAASAGHRQV
jgi:hypothetical protein